MKLTEKHVAVVADNKDPEHKLRIKVKCAAVMGHEDVVLNEWILPKLTWGFVVVPDIGEQVEIEMVAKSDTEDFPGQAFIDTPEIRWTGTRFQGPAAYDEMFTTNYGKRRGFVTPAGHILMFDDTKGREKINLVWHSAEGKYAMISMDETGSIIVANQSGSMLYLNAETKEASLIDENGNSISTGESGVKMVDRAGDYVELNADSKMVQVQASAVYVGGLTGTDPGVLANKLLAVFRTHVHPTGVGPSGPPTEAPPLAFDIIKSQVLNLK